MGKFFLIYGFIAIILGELISPTVLHYMVGFMAPAAIGWFLQPH